MKLIREFTEEVAGLVVENTTAGKQYYFEGPFLQSEVVNKNKRKYGRAMMEQEVARYINEMVNTKRAVGELGHPPTPTVNYERASHRIVSLVQEGNNWIGKAKVLTNGDFPMGNVARGLIEEGINFGVSSRGLGKIVATSQGINEVTNLRIATAADIVFDPSAPDAFVRGIMEEVDWVMDPATDSYRAQRVIETVQEERHEAKIAPERMLLLFEQFVTSLSRK